MNERIGELAEQAGLKYHNWITNESNVNDGDFKYPRLEDIEKFAELIIRECAGACLHDDWEDPRWGRFYANKIREHFAIR